MKIILDIPTLIGFWTGMVIVSLIWPEDAERFIFVALFITVYFFLDVLWQKISTKIKQ
jgi:hypothetical protein